MNDIVEALYTDFPYISIQRIYKYEDRFITNVLVRKDYKSSRTIE